MTKLDLWSSEDAVKATGGRSAANWTAGGVSIDSRTVDQGDLFIALSGPQFDGHKFVKSALAQGASAAMVSRVPDDLAPDAPLLLVDDTLQGLIDLGHAGRERSTARICAVTGSVGKTSTKEALRLALSQSGETHASVASYNNHWGVPLSLARMPREAEYGVFELGMNHAGELAPLSRQVSPHVALITNVEPVHLEYFDSVSDIADAKAEVFSGLEQGGIAILNRDNAYFEHLRTAALAAGAGRVIGFGSHGDADARLTNLAVHPTCSCISADICGQAVTYKVGAPGRHWANNSLAVLAAVVAMQADLGLAALALADMSPLKGRGRRTVVSLEDASFVLIDDSYNASPVSMRAGLELLGATQPGPRGRRIAVLGDMLELGEDSAELHAGLADEFVGNSIDLVFLCGDNMEALHDILPGRIQGLHAADSATLLPHVLSAVRPGDVVLVKGSLGSRMEPIVTALLDIENLPPQAAVQ